MIKGKVLLMDDEVIIIHSSARGLKNLQYEVETARDGFVAIELYRSAIETGTPFDAVVLDLIVTGSMGGVETIKKLLEIDPDAKAIIASGSSKDSAMTDFRKYGFKGVLAKPYEICDLDEAIQEVRGV